MQRIAEETVTQWHNTIRRQGVRADQMALVAVDPRTHFIKALVGGVDYKKSQFNRATQAHRQPALRLSICVLCCFCFWEVHARLSDR
jgi:penicillin-binding protein 1A